MRFVRMIKFSRWENSERLHTGDGGGSDDGSVPRIAEMIFPLVSKMKQKNGEIERERLRSI